MQFNPCPFRIAFHFITCHILLYSIFCNVTSGSREFVPFPKKLEFNIENIKHVCLKHFAPFVGYDVVCDVLTGEQGPACKCHNQIPDVVFDSFLIQVLISLMSTMLQVQRKGRQLTALASVVLSQWTIGRLRLQNLVLHLPWKSNLVLLNSKNPQKTLGLQSWFLFSQ